MVYIKVKKDEFGSLIRTINDEIIIKIFEDNFYSICPQCQKSRNIDFEELKEFLNTGGDFSSTSIFCDECSRKEIERKKLEKQGELV